MKNRGPSSIAILTPANGMDYKTKTEVLTAFREGRDFVYTHQRERVRYITIDEYEAGQMVKFRYNKKKHACFYTVAEIDKVRARNEKIHT